MFTPRHLGSGLATASLVLALAACGGTNDEAASSTVTVTRTTVATVTPQTSATTSASSAAPTTRQAAGDTQQIEHHELQFEIPAEYVEVDDFAGTGPYLRLFETEDESSSVFSSGIINGATSIDQVQEALDPVMREIFTGYTVSYTRKLVQPASGDGFLRIEFSYRSDRRDGYSWIVQDSNTIGLVTLIVPAGDGAQIADLIEDSLDITN